jgi:hypothetical protein
MGNVKHIGKMRNAYTLSVRNLQEKKPLGIPKFRCEESIKIDQRMCRLILTASEFGP